MKTRQTGFTRLLIAAACGFAMSLYAGATLAHVYVPAKARAHHEYGAIFQLAKLFFQTMEHCQCIGIRTNRF